MQTNARTSFDRFWQCKRINCQKNESSFPSEKRKTALRMQRLRVSRCIVCVCAEIEIESKETKRKEKKIHLFRNECNQSWSV